MTLWDLFFLFSVLLLLSLVIALAVRILQRRWGAARRTVLIAGSYVAAYAAVLIVVALAMPRLYLAPGERRCFDDWCVAAISCEPLKTIDGNRIWLAKIEVSSVAKRVRQRARDAQAEMEDTQGRRYPPSAAPLCDEQGIARSLSDELGPGESFQVLLPFRLPPTAQPAGLVMHHGSFPGAIIIAEDSAVFHPPALARLDMASGR